MRVIQKRLALIGFLLALPVTAYGKDVTLAWDASTDATVTGYVVLHGTVLGEYPDSVDVGNITHFTWTSLPDGVTHYFAVQAYNAQHMLSGLAGPVASVPSDVLPSSFAPPIGSPAPSRIDMVLQNQTNGLIAGWTLTGTSVSDQAWIWPNRVSDPNWRVVAFVDIDRDGSRDLVLQHRTNGGMIIWYMNGTMLRQQVWMSPSQVADPYWRIVAAADFDGDGKVDLVFQHELTGQMVMWLMNGATLRTQLWLTPNSVGDVNWRIVGSADYDGDGSPDLFFQNQATGQMVVWRMLVSTLSRQEWITPNQVDPQWRIAALTDVNADMHPDIVFQNRYDGRLVVWPLNGPRLSGTQVWMTPDRVTDPAWRISGAR